MTENTDFTEIEVTKQTATARNKKNLLGTGENLMSRGITFNIISIKNLESVTHSQKKWTETVPEKVRTLHLLDKDFKSAFKNRLKENKEPKETRRTNGDYQQRGRNYKRIMQILERKSIMMDTENSLGFY